MPFGRLTRISVLSLLVVAFLAGCGSDKKDLTAPPLVPPTGYTVVADSQSGFSIAVPEDWVKMPLVNLKIYDEAAERLKGQDPGLTDTLERGRLFVGRGQLFAFDPADGAHGSSAEASSPAGGVPSPAGKGASTVGLIASDAGADEKLEVVAQQAGQYLAQGGATGFTSEGAILAGGPAIKATFAQPQPTSTGTKDVAYTQYYVLRDGQSYVLTLTGAAPELETITQSLKIA